MDMNYQVAVDPSRTVGSASDASFAQFFKRPILLHSYEWSKTSHNGRATFINPWALYFGNPLIRSKIETFKMMRARLKVKVVCNANGFVYGSKIVYYHPMFSVDTTAGYANYYPVGSGEKGNNVGEVAMDDEDIVRHSQKQHGFLIPSVSQGCTLELPFMWPTNWISLCNKDVEKLGVLFLYPLNRIRSIQTTSTPKCNVSIFAWCEDIELTLPTTQPISITTGGTTTNPYPFWPWVITGWNDQPIAPSSEVAVSHSGDEYATGPVSKIANTVALAGDAASKVPVIGPYARATSMIAGAVGRVASMFGYSRPAIVQDIVPYKPVYFGNLSNTDAGDTSYKLTVDSKQEVTIDPRVVGLGPQDEMTIRSIASRESYFKTVNWTATQDSNHAIVQIAVTPMMVRKAASAGSTSSGRAPCHFTACAYASVPFGAWRGTMRYRFQLVASQFHKGRIRVVWDPHAPKPSAGGSATLLPNADQYSRIVDLATTRDFTIDIGWGSNKSYLPLVTNPAASDYSAGAVWHAGNTNYPAAFDWTYTNGVVGVYVLNRLIGTTADTVVDVGNVEINVFVSCPDLEVVNPCENLLQNYSLAPDPGVFEATPYVAPIASGDQIGTDIEIDTGVAVSHSGFEEDFDVLHPPLADLKHHYHIGPPIKTLESNTSSVFYGDPIVSLRTMMKRYCYYNSLPARPEGDDEGESTVISFVLPDFPQSPGIGKYAWGPNMITDGVIVLGKVKAYAINFCKGNFVTFYSNAFLCRRGGVRWKYVYTQPSHVNEQADGDCQFPYTLTVSRGLGGPPRVTHKALTQEGTPATGWSIPASHQGSHLSRDLATTFPSGEAGMFVTATQRNPVAEVEIPFYTNRRFLNSYPRNISGPLTDNDRDVTDAITFPMHKVVITAQGTSARAHTLTSYFAAADDFSLSMYLGPPVLYGIPNFYTDDKIKLIPSPPYTKVYNPS